MKDCKGKNCKGKRRKSSRLTADKAHASPAASRAKYLKGDNSDEGFNPNSKPDVRDSKPANLDPSYGGNVVGPQAKRFA